MSEQHSSTPAAHRSILLAVDTGAPPLSVLEAAATLAAEWQAQLAGLFVEDIDLLRAAALPCSSELDIATAAVRPLESLGLARSLRQRAEAMRAALERQAATSRIEWSFRTSQGEFVREILAAGGETELFILCRSVRGTPPARRTAPSRVEARRAAPSVLTVVDGAEESSHILRVAARLARLSGARLVVATPSSLDATSIAALRNSCQRLLGDEEIKCEVHGPPIADALQLLEAAYRWQSGWLVIGRECPLLDEVHLRKLAQGLGHPIVLVRSATKEPAEVETP